MRKIPAALALLAPLLCQVAVAQPTPPGVYTTIIFPLSPEHSASGINAAGEIVGDYFAADFTGSRIPPVEEVMLSPRRGGPDRFPANLQSAGC